MSTQQTPAKVPYRVKAESVEACNCHHGCNCQFAGYPNEGKCEFIVGFEVKDGRFGDVSLNGLKAVVAAKYPNAIHEGNGHVVLFIDDKATSAQVDAFATILSGKMGGMPWEALAGTIGRFEGPIRKAIDIKAAGERSHVRVPGAIDLQLTPFRDVISGAERKSTSCIPRAASSGTTRRSQRPRRCTPDMGISRSNGRSATPPQRK